MSSPADILIVEDLVQAFGGVKAVSGCSLSVPAGGITALIGPNGAGKTTLINVVTGTYPVQHGRVTFDGHVISGWNMHRIAQLGLIRTFQISRDYGGMTVLENMMVPPRRQAGESLWNIFFRPRLVVAEEKRHLEKALDTLNTFGIYALRNEYARNLSGGQKRLLELARALMADPKLLLLDEPMAGVNPALADRLAQHILELRDMGISFLMVEHNLDIVDQICEKVIVMAQGQALATGTMEQMRANVDVVKAYLEGVTSGRTAS